MIHERTMMSVPRCRTIAGWLVAFVMPLSAGAQRVRVEIRGVGSSDRVAGLLVALLDAHDSSVAEGLSDQNGGRILAANRPGVYRVRVRRIGFVPVFSAPLTLAADSVTTVRLTVPTATVTLPAIAVTATQKSCAGFGAGGSLAASTLWEQIATALAAAEASRNDRLVRTRVQTFERTLSAGGTPIDASVRDVGAAGDEPFATQDPGELSRKGYVVTDSQNVTHYYAPDARVLLSREFEREHCFRLVAGVDRDSALAGLSFLPIEDRGVPDIEGTLWLSRASLILERVDFQYVGARFPADVRDVGGHLEFERVESGAWFPRYWVLRMPRFRESPTTPGRLLLTGYLETGGTATPVGQIDVRALSATMQPSEVLTARPDTANVKRRTEPPTPAASAGDSAATARVACARFDRHLAFSAVGVVRDSSGATVPFATVAFEGYEISTISDRAGCFALRFPKAAELTLLARRIGYRESRRSIDLRGDSTVFLDVKLVPITVVLNGVTVTAPRDRSLDVTGFYDRMLDRKKGLGDGWFITPEDIDRRILTRMTQLLEGFPSIVLYQGRGVRNVVVPMGKGGTCVMALYVDGMRYFQNPKEASVGTTVDPQAQKRLAGAITRDSETVPLDDIVGPTAIAAVEVYPRAAEAPTQFQPLNGNCGVIVVWTKR